MSGVCSAVLMSLSKDDIHSWTGAHDLKVWSISGGGVQLFLGLFPNDDFHSWIGAHDLKVSGQFQVNFRGVGSCS